MSWLIVYTLFTPVVTIFAFWCGVVMERGEWWLPWRRRG